MATHPDGGWYRRLRKPDWQPPAIAFPVVWTALYTEIAAYRGALAANLLLNASWSWLVWRARRPWLAAAECAVLTVSSEPGHLSPAPPPGVP